MEKISVKGLALGIGTAYALCMFFLGIAAMFNWGTELVLMMSSVYFGFNATILGAIIGAIWAFIDGAIFGAIIALVYNRFA
jgi:hypothetical protein